MALHTPETDTQTRRVCLNWDNQGNHVREVVFAELARKLENERNEARAKIERLHAECRKYRLALNRIAHPESYGVKRGYEKEIARRTLVIGVPIDPLLKR
jgi:hypothetical protein